MIVSLSAAILWLFYLNSQISVSHSFRVTRLRLFHQNIVIWDHSSTSIYLSQYCASKKTLSTQLKCVNNNKDSDSNSDSNSKKDLDSCNKTNDQFIPTSSRNRAVNNSLQAVSWLSKSLLSFATYVSYKDVIHPLSVQALVTQQQQQQQQQQQKGVKGYEAAESAFSPGKVLPSYIIPILPQSALLNSLNIIDNKLVSEMQNYLESFVQLINPTLRQIKQIENKDSSLWKNLRLNAQRAAGMFIYNRNEFIPSNNTLVDNLRQQQQRDFFNQQQSNTTSPSSSSTSTSNNKENNYFFATNKIDQEVFEELQKTQFRQRYLNNLKYDVLNLVRASEQADTIECLRFMRNSLNSLLEVAYLLTPFSSSSSGITVERDPPISLTSSGSGSGSKSSNNRGGDSSNNNAGTLLYEVQTGTRRRTEVTLEQLQLEQQQSRSQQPQSDVSSSTNNSNKKAMDSNSGNEQSDVVIATAAADNSNDDDSDSNNTDEFLPINNIDDKTTQYEESLQLKNQLLHLPQLIGRARVTLYFQRPGPESIMPAVKNNNRNSKNKNNNSINYFSNDSNSGVNNSGRNRSNKDKNSNNNNNNNDISTVKLVVDGINHPYTAGNFIDLCQKGYYDATVIKSHFFTYKDQNSNYLPTTTKKFYKNVSNSTKVTSSLFPSSNDNSDDSNNNNTSEQPQQPPSKQQEQLELEQRIELYDHNVNMTLFGATSLTSGSSGGSGTTAAVYTDPTTGRVRRIPLEILRQRTGTSSSITASTTNSNSNSNDSNKKKDSNKNKNNNNKDKSSSSTTSPSPPSKYITNNRYIATGMARNTALYTKYKPVLSFATYGAIGMYHDPYDGNGASASFFYLPSQSQRRDTSTYYRHASSVIQRLNDRYSLFAYVIEGLDILERLREGDVLLSVTIEDGAWELEQLSE